MKKYIPLFLIILASCETVFHPVLPSESNSTVVYSFFRPDEPIRFDVFGNNSILKPASTNFLSNLTIDLYENDEFLESIVINNSNAYLSNAIARSNTPYRFEILTTDDGIVASNSTIPNAIAIKEATFSFDIEGINLGEYGYPASMTFTDPANESNYYAVEIFVDNCNGVNCNEGAVSGELNEILIEEVKVNTSGDSEVNIGDGSEGIGGLRYIYLSDKNFEGQTFTFDFFIVPSLIDPDDHSDVKVSYVLKSITEDYYQYLLTSDYQTEIEEGGTLSEPVQVYSNIKNGLGVFASYGMSVHTITLE